MFGVSGVGKTASCEAFALTHPEVLYVRAGAILADAKHVSGNQLRTADASEIISNQSILGTHLRALRSDCWEKPVLIDAHATIDNDRTLVEIPCEVVATLQPNGIILLEAPPDVVAARRRKAPQPRPERSLDHIRLELLAERRVVFRYASALKLPVEVKTVIDPFVLEPAMEALRQRMTN